MVMFNEIYTEFENTKDVCDFCTRYAKNGVAIRFLLIRSLEKNNLIEIIKEYSIETPLSSTRALTNQVYNSSITISQLITYINEQRDAIIKKRKDELSNLNNIIRDFPIVNCGIRNDTVDDIVKSLVRNKAIKTIHELEDYIDGKALKKIRQYILWSYYNQTSNDIIELNFLMHPKIIPTLRKIHNIDFFIHLENDVIPFDLKFTYISDAYFDIFSRGLDFDDTGVDSFLINNSSMSEISKIKKFYSDNKRTWNLGNFGGLSKLELIDKLQAIENAGEFIDEIKKQRRAFIESTSSDLRPLEWWNYKYQGERLFCNNNRLFVFTAYKDKFIDGRPLKGKIDEIGALIKANLDMLTLNDIHKINYFYDKDKGLLGDYTAKSLSMIYTE